MIQSHKVALCGIAGGLTPAAIWGMTGWLPGLVPGAVIACAASLLFAAIVGIRSNNP